MPVSMPRVFDGAGDRALVGAIAAGRVALGASFTLAPGLSLRLWPGGEAGRQPLARLLARSVGGRDLAIGLGTLMAMRHDAPLRGWLEAGVLADAADALAIGLGFRHIPRTRAAIMLALAAGTAVVGRRLAGSASSVPA